jgi:hypothetical protein
MTAIKFVHEYEVRTRKDHCGVDLISDVLPFGHLWYGEPNAVSNAIGYAPHKFPEAPTMPLRVNFSRENFHARYPGVLDLALVLIFRSGKL